MKETDMLQLAVSENAC